MQAPVETYARFVPRRLLLRHGNDLEPPDAPRAERCTAAVLFVDVVGYTGLTERYSQSGSEGVEKLSARLKALFTYLDERIARHGGDIMSFAGDSLLAIWSDESQGAPVTQALLAARCGHDILANLDQALPDRHEELRLSIVVAAGEALVATVGGVEGQWLYVAAGEAFAAAGAALHRSEPGRVVVTAGAWKLIGERCKGDPLGGGYFRLAAIPEPVPLPAFPNVEVVAGMSAALRRYIPRSVLDCLDAGQSDWLAEFRRVSTLFLSISALDFRAEYAVSRLHAVVSAIQVATERYEGALTRVAVDDKGTCVLCAWGVPGRQHEDDAERALWAALAITEALRDAGVGCAAGLTTGRVLCGLSGSGSRHEYTVTGEAVNLASRLMVAAQTGVLCDEATRKAASASFYFEELAPLRLKGASAPVAAARPLASRVKQVRTARLHAARDRRPARLVGRDAERKRLLASLDLLHAGSGALITLEGEAGIGKSSLISEFTAAAQKCGIDCLLGAAEAIEQGTTYFAWRGILGQIFDREDARDAPARRRFLESLFEGRPDLRAWLPLLEDVLPVGFREDTSAMDERARGNTTSDLMLHVLRAALARTLSVIVLEDVHWMDSVSWELAVRLQHSAQPLVIVLVRRDDRQPRFDAEKELLALPENDRIGLETLSREDTEAIIRDRLGVRSIAPEILSFAHEKAGGHPLYTEELVHALDDSGSLRIDGEHCALSGDAKHLERLKLTATVEQVISSRIDRLSPALQFTLRVASVTGRSFPARLISGVHPVERNEATIAGHFETLTALDFIRADPESAEPRYFFKHVIMRDVAYGSFAPDGRKALHRRIGEWYEEQHLDDLHAVYPLLAHHWYEANVAPKAAEFLHKAGEQAFDRYANREAIGFLEQALKVAPSLEAAAAGALKMRCERLLGYAQLWLGNWLESRDRIRNSLALLGSPVPSSRGALLRAVLGQLVHAACAGLIGPWLARRAAQATEAERHGVMGLLRLGHVAYFNGDNFLASYTSLRLLNFAGRRQPFREVAQVYSVMTVGASMLPLHGLACRYAALALKATRMEPDPYVRSEVMLFVTIYTASVGKWRSGIVRLSKAAKLSIAAGAARQTEQCMLIRGYHYFHSGKLDMALRDFDAAAAGGLERGDAQLAGWGLLGVSRTRLAQGRPSDALTAIHRAAPLATDWLGRVEVQGQSALAYLREGDSRRALNAAHKGLKAVLQIRPTSFSTPTDIADVVETLLGLRARPTSFSTLTGTAGVAETLLRLWAAVPEDRRWKRAILRRAARAAIRSLRRFARIFPIGLPQALLHQGFYWFMAGRRQRARSLWSRALDVSVRYRMMYEEARVADTIARYGAESERGEALRRANELFGTLGVVARPETGSMMSDNLSPPGNSSLAER